MQSSITNDVLMHHLTAFGNNDLAKIMLDYKEDSEVLTSTGSIKGLSAITVFFQIYLSQFLQVQILK